MADTEDTKRRDPTAADLISRIEAIRAKAQARAQAAAQALPSARVIQLPLWPEPVRAVPNGILRSALFGAIAKGKRRYIDGEQIAALDGIEIRYTGPRLDQGDLDVWQSVLHAVRYQELGSHCRVTSYALLKLMGKADTGGNRSVLQKRIERLVATAVTLTQGRYTYIGSLIRSAAKDEETQEWVIELDPKLRPLFARDQFTLVEWAVRRTLDGKPLAQWLHGFYASHVEPFPMKVETIRRLCGSENKELFSFRQELRDALSKLASVTGWTWQIDEQDLVHVHTRPTPSQTRHLIRKKLKTTSKKRPKG